MSLERTIWVCVDELDDAECTDPDDRDARIEAHRRHSDCGYWHLMGKVEEPK